MGICRDSIHKRRLTGGKKKNGEKKENMSLVGNLRIQKLELKESL